MYIPIDDIQKEEAEQGIHKPKFHRPYVQLYVDIFVAVICIILLCIKRGIIDEDFWEKGYSQQVDNSGKAMYSKL